VLLWLLWNLSKSNLTWTNFCFLNRQVIWFIQYSVLFRVWFKQVSLYCQYWLIINFQLTGRLFSTGTLVSSTNKTECHDITEILLKVVLNTINQHKSTINWLICNKKCKLGLLVLTVVHVLIFSLEVSKDVAELEQLVKAGLIGTTVDGVVTIVAVALPPLFLTLITAPG
jgi:hypothetical protein